MCLGCCLGARTFLQCPGPPLPASFPLACWRFCTTGCITPRNSIHSCSESLCPEIVRAGRRGSLACQASPARRTFGLPHAAAPEALAREGGDAQFCVTSQIFRCLDFRSCVRGGVRVLTGVGARAGALLHQAFGRGRAREVLEQPPAGQTPGVGRRFYRTFDEGCHGALCHEAPTSAGEWAPVEFGKNLRARPSLDRGPGGTSGLRRPAHSCGAFGPSLCSVPVCVRG